MLKMDFCAGANIELFDQVVKDWKPQRLTVDFKSGQRSVDALMMQIAFAIFPGTEGSFSAAIMLPPQIKRDLTRLLKQRKPGAGDRRAFAYYV